MSMTSLLAYQDYEERAFVEALATRHFYKAEPVLEQSMWPPEPIKSPYFNCEDEDERETRVSQLDVFQHSDSSLGTNDNKDNARGGQDPLAVAIQRKRERRKKHATKATKKLSYIPWIPVPLRPYLTISSVFHITFQQSKEPDTKRLVILTLRAHIITGFSTGMAKPHTVPLGTFE
eukprot:jgi/Psemu1/11598/gm1.11598_g